MQIECLDYFRKIAEVKSISKVATNSHISQSALSQQMQRLEESIGYKLFERSNRGVELTAGGKIVLKYTTNIIRTYDKMMEELNNQGREMKNIKIEAAWTIATYCLPCALYKMKVKHPLHNYDLISNTPDKIEQDVINDICDIGFITSNPLDKSLLSYKVSDERVVLVSPPNLHLPEQIKLEELLDNPLIALKGRCIIKENLTKQLEQNGYHYDKLNVVFELESTEAVKELILKGYGLAFLPYSAVKKEIYNKQMHIVKVDELNLNYCIYLIQKAESVQDNKEFVTGFKALGKHICC